MEDGLLGQDFLLAVPLVEEELSQVLEAVRIRVQRMGDLTVVVYPHRIRAVILRRVLAPEQLHVELLVLVMQHHDVTIPVDQPK